MVVPRDEIIPRLNLELEKAFKANFRAWVLLDSFLNYYADNSESNCIEKIQ